MIIQEEKVEIVEPKELVKQEFKMVPQHQKRHHKHFIKFILSFVFAVFLILLIIFGGFTFYNLQNNDIIAKGVYISGIDVSGKTKREALTALSSKFKKLEKSNIKLVSKNYETIINPTAIKLNYDLHSAVNYAFAIGKSGKVFDDNYEIFNTMINGIEIEPTYSVDEEALKKMLDNFSKELPEAVVESSYYIDGLTLIITKGTDGYVVDSDKTATSIKSKIKDYSFASQPIQLSLNKQAPKPVDVDKIYSEVHKAPQDAYYTTKPYAVYPSKTGIDFKISIDKTKQKVAKSKKECKIALKTLYPKVTTNMIGREAFPKLLASFSTHYPASNVNRTTNLRLAAKKVNGTVLLPGETFSYNKVVGERSIAAGYKEAAIYANGAVVDGLGGGICQISTTLFNAVLFANLNIVELHNHQFVPSYVGAGRDATVVYGSKDFRFSNSRKHAIKIEMSVSGGVASCQIYGVKEDKEYDVDVNAYITSQSGSYTTSTTYRTLNYKGKRVSKERIYSCTYKRH